MPNLSTIHKSADLGDLQNMYRRSLAASWAATKDELPADQCIEDIFSGGDGWKREDHDKGASIEALEEESISNNLSRSQHGRNLSGDNIYGQRKHHRSQSGSSINSQTTILGKEGRIALKHSSSRETLARSPGNQNLMRENSLEASQRGRTGLGSAKAHEVDEFDMRDNLVAWKLP
jgi:hypothetical protein